MTQFASFTRRAAMGSALAASASVSAVAGVAGAAVGGGIRDSLDLAPDVRYFNAANIGPAFKAVIAAQSAETRAFQANPSMEFRERYPQEAIALRQRLGARWNVSGEEIAILRNCSEGNTVAMRGLALKPGDEVVLTDHNHPSMLESWRLRAEREGLVLRIVKVPAQPRGAGELVDLFAAQIGPKTRFVGLSHVSNLTGLVFPVKEIAALTRGRDIWLHVDGAQSFGWLRLDLPALGVDSYAGSTHKWLMGPLEGGVLYVRRAGQARLQPLMMSHGYWLLDKAALDTAQKYEVLGQRDDPKLRAIHTTLDAVERLGEARIEAEARQVGDHLRAAFANIPGARLYGSAPDSTGPTSAFAFPGHDAAAVRKALWSRGKVATALQLVDGQSLIRFSPHIYNSRDEIAQVADLLKGVLA